MSATVYEKMINRNVLANLIPVEAYEPETKLFYLGDGYAGFGFVARPLSFCDESVAQRLGVLFSFDYPAESFIQILLIGSQDIRPQLDGFKNLRRTDEQTLKASVKNRIKMMNKGSQSALSGYAQSLVKEYKVVFTIKVPMQTPLDENELVKLRNIRLAFEQTLCSAGFNPQHLDAELYLRVTGNIIHWNSTANWRQSQAYYDPNQPINDQLSECDDILQIDHNGIWLGEKRLRILSPTRLPSKWSLDNMRRFISDPLSGSRGLQGNFYINLNIYIPDNTTERGKAESNRNKINYQVFGPMLKFNPTLGFMKDSADLLHEGISSGDRIVKIKLSIGLFADNNDQSQTRLTEATTYFSEIGLMMKEDKFITLPMLINALPFGADNGVVEKLKRYKTLCAKHATEFLPILGDWAGTGTPQLTFISRAGQLMSIDMFDSNTNYNTLIAAQSGSGKSFLTNDIITAYLSSGAKCWVIDIGRSYEKLTRIANGDFIEFSETSRICINPFQLIKNYDEEADMIVGIIISMAAMDDRLSDLQQSRLRAIIKTLWEEYHETLSIDLVAKELLKDDDTRVNDMGHQLFAFSSKGEYGKFFTGDTNISFTNELTCLELEELKGRSHLQQVVLLILIYQIQQSMYQGNRSQRKILIIDEGWDLLAKSNIAKFIETGYRRFRKYNGAAVTITQSLNDLYNSASGIAITENSANLYLLYQKTETIESIKQKNRLMIGEGGYQYLKTVHTIVNEYSEIFFVTSYGAGIGRLIVDPYTRLLYSTHPDDIAEIEKRQQNGMSTNDAINDILLTRSASSSYL